MKNLSLRIPVDNHKITSRFGPRMLNNKKEFHNGIDLISKSSRNVYNVLKGIVILDFDNYEHDKRFRDAKHSAGNYIIIMSKIESEIFYFKYIHLEKNFVSLNQNIKTGDLIGVYGDVGFSYGSHLHLTIYNAKWQAINPEIFFKERGGVTL